MAETLLVLGPIDAVAVAAAFAIVICSLPKIEDQQEEVTLDVWIVDWLVGIMIADHEC